MSPEATTSAPSQFQFVALAVNKAVYEFLGGVIAPTDKSQPNIVTLEVGASAHISVDATHAFVRLEVKVLPDQTIQPYRIEVAVGATFTSQNATHDELLKFCRMSAPSILFPYIRETVHRLTMDAPYGAVRLDPVNISMLLNTTEWSVSSTPVEATAGSTEPGPPSSR